MRVIVPLFSSFFRVLVSCYLSFYYLFFLLLSYQLFLLSFAHKKQEKSSIQTQAKIACIAAVPY